MRFFGLLGYPLSHSFSQNYFSEKFARQGIRDCSYQNYSIPDIAELPALFEKYPALAGLNITIPYKKQVIPFLTEISPVVAAIGACNCMHIRNSERIGYNTDIIGFEGSLKRFIRPHHTRALILGTGGASAAVAYVLREMDIAFSFVSRHPAPGVLDYAALDKSVLETHHLLINTTPLGMYPDTKTAPPIPYEWIGRWHHLYDLIYNPAETVFLAKGRAQGATVQNGLEMLELQAEESWRIWNT
ncbi:MAG TPA: shikimate dehydrogenase [Sediminibacterium sp.]|nr:shikimate dehydrogenase [Sediminibacterium sp.]